MLAVKAVKFRYQPTSDILDLLKTFRDMVNEAIAVGLEKKPKNRFQLTAQIYDHFKKKYHLHTHYILNACECAFAILKNHWRRGRRPYAKHLFLKLDNQTYHPNYMLLRLPVKPRQSITIPMTGSNYHLSFLRDATLRRGSVTLTEKEVILAFSKETAAFVPCGKVGYDLNERNITGVSTISNTPIIHDTSKVAYNKQQYSMIKQNFKRNDVRIRRRLFRKYGKRQRNKVNQSLHVVSKKVVQHAKKHRLAVVLEELTNIRNSMSKRNGQGKNLRRRLNSWSFRELQRQIDYKAAWEGVPVEYVTATNTSKTCSHCGRVNKAIKYDRVFTCPSCGLRLDRDVNASRNILLRACGSGLEGEASEGLKQSKDVDRMPLSEFKVNNITLKLAEPAKGS